MRNFFVLIILGGLNFIKKINEKKKEKQQSVMENDTF